MSFHESCAYGRPTKPTPTQATITRIPRNQFHTVHNLQQHHPSPLYPQTLSLHPSSGSWSSSSAACCGAVGTTLLLLKPAEGWVRQSVTCPIRYGIIYASIWVEQSHVIRVLPLWQNQNVVETSQRPGSTGRHMSHQRRHHICLDTVTRLLPPLSTDCVIIPLPPHLSTIFAISCDFRTPT